MAIEFYTNSVDASKLEAVATGTRSNVVANPLPRNQTINVSDTGTRGKYQYGYGTTPVSAETIEGSSDSSAQKAKADGSRRSYDTSSMYSEIKASISEQKLGSSGATSSSGDVDFTGLMNSIHRQFYLPVTGEGFKTQLYNMYSKYNRFKLPNYDMEIKKGFAHVFFVRPMCNLLEKAGELKSNVRAEGAFFDIFEQNPVLVNEISDDTVGHDNDFMMILSNYVKSFSLNDEELHSDTYGRTYTGYKISYGKTNIESKTAGNISVTFSDDKILSIYKIHRMWTDYINGVYRGRLDPNSYNIMNKVLDYVGAIYYILTADDGETVLFWSKYYGVYPTSIPSSQYSWNSGSFVNPETITIQYNYSWKEDFNPTAIVEFNANAKVTQSMYAAYAPTFDKTLFHMGDPLVGVPYIERVTNAAGELPYYANSCYKLRFMPIKS